VNAEDLLLFPKTPKYFGIAAPFTGTRRFRRRFTKVAELKDRLLKETS